MAVRNCSSCGRPMNVDLAMCPWCAKAAADTRPCPYCAEPVRLDAFNCRWCGERLPAAGPGAGPYAPPPGPVVPAPPGTTPLILGLLGILFCQLLAPFAWWAGQKYEDECRAMGLQPDGAGTAGKILGIIGTILLVLGCGCGGVFFLPALLAGGLSA